MTTAKRIAAATLLCTLAWANQAAQAQTALSTQQVIDQVTNSVEATFGNTLVQTVSSDVAPSTLTVTGAAALINTATATVTPGFTAAPIGGSTLAGPTTVTASTALAGTPTATAPSVLQITAVAPAATATSLTTSTTVFGLESLKVTQSVLDSTVTSQF